MTSSQLHGFAVVAIATCWGIFGLTWLAGAVYNAARGPTERTRSRYQYAMAIGWVVVVVIFAVVPSSDWHFLEAETLWVSLVGLAILVGSTLFTLWARLTLGTMWSSDPTVKQHHELRTDGPYGITRHPIYTGMLGMLLGSVLMAGVGRWVVLFPVMLVLFEIKLHIEERLMATTFPDDYPRYRHDVPQLVPALRLARRRHVPGV